MKHWLCVILILFGVTSCGAPPVSVETISSGTIQTGTLTTGSGQIENTQSGVSSVQSGTVVSGEWSNTVFSQKPPLCIMDACLDTKKPFFEDGDMYVQLYYTGANGKVNYFWKSPGKWEESGIYKINYQQGMSEPMLIRAKKDSSYIAKGFLGEMGEQKDEYYIMANLIVKKNISAGCGYIYRQEFYDKQGKKLVDPTPLLPKYPESIQAGNMRLTIDWSGKGEGHLFDIKIYDGPFTRYLDTLSLSGNLNKEVLTKVLDKGSNGTFNYYALSFQEIPGVTFYYKSSLPPSESILELPIKESTLDARGNLMDIEITKKILSYYPASNVDNYNAAKIGRQIRKKGDKENYIGIGLRDFTPQMMPLFRLVAIDKGQYALYAADKYEGFSSAELCKPLVYIYDANNRDNTLSVSLPRGGAFTRIIPDFSTGNTWEYRADTSGDILAWGQKFPYLYYSARVPDYRYNTLGWQVFGRDVRAFFSEKLDTIGFNTREKSDFIEYWKNEFHPDTLYFVSFKFDEAMEPYASLHFEKKPQSQIRVLLEAYPLSLREKNTQILWPQVNTRLDAKLLKTFHRSGIFDVLEWGGTVQKEEGSPIVIH